MTASNAEMIASARLAVAISWGVEEADNYEILNAENIDFAVDLGISEEDYRARASVPQLELRKAVEATGEFFITALTDYPTFQDAMQEKIDEWLHYWLINWLYDGIYDLGFEYFDVLRMRDVPFEEAEELSQKCDEEIEMFMQTPEAEILRNRVITHLANSLQLER
jgi:hypothetical protein